ncbi:MAG: shikimate dehydrogenase [Bacteroidales bacterium]|nr:shikimate dehydrogenase [Bacteroidales bacterium]
MKNYGLIGKTLKHSFSKKFFTEKFSTENIDAQYELYELDTIEKFPQLISSVTLSGLNVTIPYKEQVIAYLDEVDPIAKAIGAVNTIQFKRKGNELKLCGYNTDVIGFKDSILPHLKPVHKKALILGTGGASKAIYYALNNLGIETLYVSRTPKEGQITYNDLDKAILSDYLLIVNCSPIGMYPNIDQAPDIPYKYLTNNHFLYDLVYNPENTKFCQMAREMNAFSMNGLEMLHGQALASWEIWNK